MPRLLIAGCGDLGLRLARRLRNTDWTVTGLRRRPDRLSDDLIAVGADLFRPDTLKTLETDWDAVVYQATPSLRDETGYRQAYVEGLSNLLEHVRTDRLLYVSSTSVYGQDDGEWVDERSLTQPARFNGRLVLEGERIAREAVADAVAVRFAGIYGPGRDALLRSLRDGRATCREDPPQWTNRVHVEDCAAVLAHLLELDAPEPVYCASDGAPTPRCQVLDWLSHRLDLPAPERLASQASGAQGKRVANNRLLATGFRFEFPDYRHGYGAMLP
ncbi:NAD(P)H-binding protein [Wenzhouxiangella sp. AB-CW3]|uniref:NAD-dependent epimerase/dehydratase family protein n=1 Tax=Wenzhouxiangella sp. AB-CW3 TaxID=2771012 RepID=UPI00168B314F|nr:NAD-dependent epimerase/dehydratase family protein [Wenzhouxiangella sp. AB-CW3]QOC22427.1 NAD(P)H-binding protein [Wenzhouxiangella sp. AB-CW3]